jgi:predicted transcriptional regulator
MHPTFARLQETSDEELVAQLDRIARTTMVGTEFYLDELARRSSAHQTAIIVRSTETIRRLTWWIAGLTAIVAVLTAVSAVVVVAGAGG